MASYELAKLVINDQNIAAEELANHIAYIEGVNSARLGISNNQILERYRYRPELIEYVKKGLEESSAYVGEIIKTPDFSDTTTVNELSRHIQNQATEYEVVGMLHIESSGDSFFIPSQGSDNFITLKHKNHGFYVVISICRMVYLNGSVGLYYRINPTIHTEATTKDNSLKEIKNLRLCGSSFKYVSKNTGYFSPTLEADSKLFGVPGILKALNRIAGLSRPSPDDISEFPFITTVCRSCYSEKYQRRENYVSVYKSELVNGLTEL